MTTGIYSKTYSSGEIYYLQARDFDVFGTLKADLEPSLLVKGNTEKHYLDPGNVLIAAKGFDHFAAVFKGEYAPAVASSIFIVLRNIDQTKVLPDFLAWYINHPQTQKYLNGNAKGTSLPSINKKILSEMEIDLTPIEKQKTIMKVSQLKIKEKRLKNEIEALQETLFNQQLINALNK